MTVLAAGLLAGADARRPARTMLRVAAPEQNPPLDSAAFKATLDGNPTKVLRVRGPKDDLLLLVVLDLSGDLTLIDAARAALQERLNALQRNTWVAVLKSQDGLALQVAPQLMR